MSPLVRRATMRNLAAGRTRPLPRQTLRQWLEKINPEMVVGAVMLLLLGFLAGWQVADLVAGVAR